MPEPPAFSEPVVYQLRVVLRGVSPLIWRRLLVRSHSTIADLHASLQRVLGWSDEHLNRFVIHGRDYGVWHDGGIGFRDDPRYVCLADLRLCVGERFLYEYDFTDGWQHDVRLEQILLLEARRAAGSPIWYATVAARESAVQASSGPSTYVSSATEMRTVSAS